MFQCSVISSLAAASDKTQAGLAYLCTALARRGATWELIDLTGSVVFQDAPEELYQQCDSPEWLSADAIRRADWMDEYLPASQEMGNMAFFSAQFSPDVVFHARHSHNIKTRDPRTVTAIGGAALMGLREDQLDVLAHFFDHILIGYDVEGLLDRVFDEPHRGGQAGVQSSGKVAKSMTPPAFQPDYSLLPLEELVTVYAGHGCYHGQCKFCDFPSRADRDVYFRPPEEVAADLRSIQQLGVEATEAFLTQDSYSKQQLLDTAAAIGRQCGSFPYSLMVRAEPWLTEEIGEVLAATGCADVFMGAEGLDDEILSVIEKGVSTEQIIKATKALSRSVDVTLGMILFLPGINEHAMQAQLSRLADLLPYVTAIEPEILTVVSGSEFARHPSRYGIVLDATENVLNDSWCFGLSQDIPWTMADPDEIGRWFRHVEQLKRMCDNKVEPVYWASLEKLADDLRPSTLGRSANVGTASQTSS